MIDQKEVRELAVWIFSPRCKQRDQPGQRPPGASPGVSTAAAQVSPSVSNEVSSQATLPLLTAREATWCAQGHTVNH